MLLLLVHGHWGWCQNGKAGVGRKCIDACGIYNLLRVPKWKKLKSKWESVNWMMLEDGIK